VTSACFVAVDTSCKKPQSVAILAEALFHCIESVMKLSPLLKLLVWQCSQSLAHGMAASIHILTQNRVCLLLVLEGCK